MIKALNAALKTTPNDDARRLLSRVQKIWARWLDARCNYINALPDSGTQANVEAELCRVDTIAERADELQAMQRPAVLAPQKSIP